MSEMQIVIWDVQHGSAAYIRTPNNIHIVQDLGTGDISQNIKEFSPLLHLRNNYNVTQLDYVIISHPHHDHIDDILNFEKLSPKVLLRPKHLTEEDIRKANPNIDDKVEKYFEINNSYSGAVEENEDPKLPQNNGGVIIHTFIPKSCDKSNINNHSVVSIFDYANSKIMIPGDNEPPSWLELLKTQSFVDACKNIDILVAPHHGRESAYCPELFDQISPRLTIISDGPCDSSAASRYSAVSSGWTVHHSDGSKEERKCLTTRKDGAIAVKFGFNPGDRPFIHVSID